MRIAQVCPRYRPYIGGIETHVAEISERLVAKGHDVTVVTTDPSGKLPPGEVINGVKVVRFPAFAPGSAYYFSPSLRSYFKREGSFDIVHAHNYHAFPAYFASSSKAPKFIFNPHYHGNSHVWLRNALLKPYKLLGRAIFERSDLVVCDSEYEKSLVCRDFPGYCGKAAVIPSGVKKSDFQSPEPYPKGLKVILYIGRLEEYKGVQYAIRALRHLPWHRLVVIGKGPYKDALVREAKTAGVPDKVAFMSDLSRDELLRWYATADVLVMLSRLEAYGITVAEALSAGVPCIVANTSALQEFIDGSSCRGVDLPVDGEVLAEEIGRAQFKGFGKKNVLDWDEVVELLLKAYEGGTGA